METGGVTLITPTGGRPEAFALCEKYMNRQTYQGPLQWIVVDDCEPQTRITMGQELISPFPRWKFGENTQFRNMLVAIQRVRFDKILIIEDDDWYAPDYIETMIPYFEKAALIGEIPTRYYNVRFRTWHPWGNDKHASLCQTGMRAEVLPLLRKICEDRRWIDMALWPAAPEKAMFQGQRNVGIKGMPGRSGQVRQHHSKARGIPDHDLKTLHSWIGEDAELYRRFGE